MPVNTATLNQLFDGDLGPIAVQEAKGAALEAGTPGTVNGNEIK